MKDVATSVCLCVIMEKMKKKVVLESRFLFMQCIMV